MEIKDVKEFFESKKKLLDEQEYNNIVLYLEKIQRKENSYNRELSDEYKIKGNNSFKGGDLNEAIYFYTKSLEADPSNDLVYSNRAIVYCKLGEEEKAIEDCENGLKLCSTFIKFYIRLAIIYSNKNSEKSKEYIKKGLEIEPKNEALLELNNSSKTTESKDSLIDPDKIASLLKNEKIKDMVKNFVGDKSPEELSEMVNSVMKNFKK